MFSTSTLDHAVKKGQNKREGLRLQVLERALGALDRLAEQLPFKEAYIFGSVTKPFGFREGSDLDIGFIGLEDRYFFKAMSFISSETGMDVDVIQLEGHRLEDKIKREGVRWTKRG